MKYQPRKFTLPPEGIWPGDGVNPPYVFNDEIAIAIDVALATDRPLLISGPPGSGKSALAPTMAGVLERRYLPHTLTSRSRLEDLTGRVDQLGRLNDANANKLKPDWAYMEPGLLWWAFEPDTATRRGATQRQIREYEQESAQPFASPTPTGTGGEKGDAVILLDEIDKAEPDLPNDLLEPLDVRRVETEETESPNDGETARDIRCFQVANGPMVEAPNELELLTIITTNGERDLPPAFLRRCVILRLRHPGDKALWTIGERHYPSVPATLRRSLARKVVKLRKQAVEEDRRPPSTSEYLDALRACDELGIPTNHRLWKHVEQATLTKNIDPDEDVSGAR